MDGTSYNDTTPPTNAGNYEVGFYVGKSTNVLYGTTEFSIDKINISGEIQQPAAGEALDASFTGNNSLVESSTVKYSKEDSAEVTEGNAAYNTKYTATVTLTLTEKLSGIKDNVTININGVAVNKNNITESTTTGGNGSEVTVLTVKYDGFETTAKANFNGDINIEGETEFTFDNGISAEDIMNGLPGEATIGTEDGSKKATIEWDLSDYDADEFKEQVLEVNGTVELSEEIGNDSNHPLNAGPVKVTVKAAEPDENGIYTKADEEKFIKVDDNGDGTAEDGYVKVVDIEDGLPVADSNGDGENEKHIPVDVNGDGGIDHHVPEGVLQDKDKEGKEDGIYNPKDKDGNLLDEHSYIGIDGEDQDTEPDKFIKVEKNDDGSYKDDSDNIYIPVDTDGNGDVDEYVIPVGGPDNNGKYTGDADGEEGDETLLPVDSDGDGNPDHYVPDGVLKDKDGDGIYTPEGKKEPEYIGKDKDGDGKADEFIKVEKNDDGLYEDQEGNVYIDVDTNGDGEADKENVPAKVNDEDGYLEADVDDKDGKEKLIPVDIDGDGDIDHYVPQDVLTDEDKNGKEDGIYTPENGSPEYIGIDEDGKGEEPDRFVKVEDSDDDGIYGDDANKDGKYDGSADGEGKEDNHYIPDQDGDGFAEPETDKDGVFEGTKDQDGDGKPDNYIPVDETGDGKTDDIVQVTDDDGDGIYEDEKDDRYIPDQDGDGFAETDPDGDGVFEGTKENKDGKNEEYIPSDTDAKGGVDEFIQVKPDDDGVYEDDANDDGVFGGEDDNAYVPVDDDADGDIDRYVPEDKFDEGKYVPVDQDGDGDTDHYVPEKAFEENKDDYTPIDKDNDGDVDNYIPDDTFDKIKDDYVGRDDDKDGNNDRYVPKDVLPSDGHTHAAKRVATCTERALCRICDEFYGEPLGHDWGSWESISGTMHQSICRNDKEHAKTGEHSPELCCGDKSKQCEVCGATGKDSHKYTNKWQSNDKADTHWYGCEYCGAKKPGSEAPHEYPNKKVGKDVPQTCSICKYGGHITEVHPEDFDKYEIPEGIRVKYKTVGEIERTMEEVARTNNQRVDGTMIFDAVLKYSVDGGINWYKASEEHFPKNGKLPVTIEVPKETSIDTHDYRVVHMFSQSSDLLRTEDGKPTVAGETETPDVIEIKEADGKEYISFYVNGLSPIMVAWEATTLNTARSIDDGENNNGEEDNAGDIPIDDNNDGEIDRYITEDELDKNKDKYVPIDKDGDGDIDYYVPKDKFDKSKYAPIDKNGDGKADYYIPNGVLIDPDGDGIYTPDGKKGPRYEGVDLDGDGIIDIYVLLKEGDGVDSGDDQDMIPWLMVMMTALTAAAITVAGRRYRRN